MAPTKDPEKTADLPPKGSRNPDPLTGTPGSHPIETGVGAALGGAASGLAVGAVAGPVGAAIGAAAGAIAGGYAGKGVGELIDPTTEDNWLRETFGDKKYVQKGESYDAYTTAYRYGGEAEGRFRDRSYDEISDELRRGWEAGSYVNTMNWDRAGPAVRDAYDRTRHIRAMRARDVQSPAMPPAVGVP